MRAYLTVIVVLFAVGAVAEAALLDGVISGWTFDDKTVNDTFGGNHGSLRGGASFAAGMTGRALDLNGQDAWAEVPHDASMDAMANGLTAACWFFTRTNTQEFPSFLWKGSQVGWAPGFLFQISIRNPGGNAISWGSSTENVEGWFQSQEDFEGKWVHGAAVADGKSMNAYFNGQQVDVSLFNGALGNKRPLPLEGPYNVFPDQPIRMGMSQGIQNDLKNKTYIDGMVDDAIIFSRALSASEILELMDTDLATAVDAKGKLTSTWARLKTRQ